MRPLGISAYVDKLVQGILGDILNAVLYSGLNQAELTLKI